ncbi:MAG TPA: aminodeoxychorismate synthase component I [Allosphingosinicella sp.]|nr:aminodeoxychorismate synthase component I [Allosphingosinicella sp.]
MTSAAPPALPLDAPFVLLDDARPGGRARLLTGLQRVISADRIDQVVPALEQLRSADEVAGFLSYEAGLALEPKLAPLAPEPSEDRPPLLWFGAFGRSEEVDAAAILPSREGAWVGAPQPLMDRDAYLEALERLHRHILAGGIYQANFTFPAEVSLAGHPLALYAGLRERARAGHGALVFTGSYWVLSLSPELFFTLEKGRVTTRPMKGTATRGADAAADARQIEALAADPKQRAENLMIVDLLRNDVSRVAMPGTVKVPELFKVETYPTVHQLVSTVTGELEPGRDLIDVLRALFPCGSITGAPKIRAMEIIAQNEIAPRGVYCGAIGRIGADGDAAFSVAIRTLMMRDGDSVARMGLGSGIVSDSRAVDEWRECAAKGAFVAAPERFDLLETMRHDAHEGIVDLDRHLERLVRSADALGFSFDRHQARNELQAASFGAGTAKVRLLLARSGAVAVEVRPLDTQPDQPVSVALARLPVPPHDFRLRHKTSNRAFYEEARAAAGTFEVLFTDPDGFLTEGSFTTVFVEREDRLLTPPLSRGLLPGILRERLLEDGRAVEADLRPEDLAGGFLIGNALRGLIPARLT